MLVQAKSYLTRPTIQKNDDVSTLSNSVADPDPESGAFLTPGSGIRDG
jgi:hypothetical protein